MPATWSQAFDSGMSRPPDPTTATISISQSAVATVMGMSPCGAFTDDANLVNVSGESGIGAPVSTAWAR